MLQLKNENNFKQLDELDASSNINGVRTLTSSLLTFLVLFIALPLTFPLPTWNLRRTCGICGICGDGILCSQGRMGGPRNGPDPGTGIGGIIDAIPRALGPPGNNGNIPLGRHMPPSNLDGGGNLCLIGM